MFTNKKNQTVKLNKTVRVNGLPIFQGTLLVVVKSGQNPMFSTRIKGETLNFSTNIRNANDVFADVVADSKVEKTISHISFKKFQAIPTADGTAMSADVYINGKKIAIIENGGYGASSELHVFDVNNQSILDEAVNALKVVRGEKITDFDPDAELVEEFMYYLIQKEDLFISFKEKMEEEREHWNNLFKHRN